MQNENESRIVYSLTVCSLRIAPKNFARFYVAVPIPDKAGWKGRVLFVDELHL